MTKIQCDYSPKYLGLKKPKCQCDKCKKIYQQTQFEKLQSACSDEMYTIQDMLDSISQNQPRKFINKRFIDLPLDIIVDLLQLYNKIDMMKDPNKIDDLLWDYPTDVRDSIPNNIWDLVHKVYNNG